MMYGLDLFSGIGGITKALDGYARPIAYCENDRYATAVLLSRMSDGSLPSAPIWDDVSTLRGDMLPRIDIIYGGFPCQDISVAGHGKGLAGKRSGLFFEIIRLVEEIRPAFVFLENVSGIRTRGGEEVIREFSRLRYDCRWGMLSAYDVGAPHIRERWWMLAYTNRQHGQRGAESQQPDSSVRKTRTQYQGLCNALAYTQGIGVEGDGSVRLQVSQIQTGQKISGCNGAGIRKPHWKTEPGMDRLVNGVSDHVGKLRGLGNSVVPQQAREAFERLMGLK